MSRSSRRGELVLLLASLSVFLLFAEAAVRLLGLGRPAPTGYAPVDTNRRAMRPKNSKGFRDRERVLPKPAGVRRLLSLGDSFAWGASVEFEDAYPQRLERALTRRRGETWEVPNLALPGMNTVDQAAQLGGEGWAYGPDAVLLGYVMNDSEDAFAAEARRADDWAQPKRPEPAWWSRSALFRMVGSRVWATAENRRRITGYRSMYANDASGWIAGRKALREMGAAARARGVPFVVAIFPLFGNPLDHRYPFEELHREVSRAAAGSGALVVDLLPAYRGLRWDLLVVDGAHDEHPNEIAHRIAAGVILRALDDAVPWPEDLPRHDPDAGLAVPPSPTPRR